MRFHTQSAQGRAIIDGKTDEIVGYGPRDKHYALDALCPTCHVRPGGPCEHNGAMLSKLIVHADRAEAAVMGE